MEPHEFHMSPAAQDVRTPSISGTPTFGEIPSTVGTSSIPGTPSIVGGTTGSLTYDCPWYTKDNPKCYTP